MAQAIHNAGAAAAGPFVAINCASIPRDLLESGCSDMGRGFSPAARARATPAALRLQQTRAPCFWTRYRAPAEFQSKLLRAVETHSIVRLGGGQEVPLDIRIITATSTKLEEAVAAGSFRQDLYFRLNVLRLDIPPLESGPPIYRSARECFWNA